MNYSSKQDASSSRVVSRKSLIGMSVVAAVLAIGVVTALSMQRAQAPKTKVEGGDLKVANESRRNYVTSNAAGQTVVIDRQTGQMSPLTPEEAHRLAEGIKQLVSQSTEGLVQVHRADGSVSMDLQGRFQNVLLAKKEADGTISQACIDNVDSAAAFFEIDPALLGASAPVSKSHPVSTKLEDR
jgi:type II secretory pathway pseudopilin PulG